MSPPDDRYGSDIAAGVATLGYSAVLNELLPEVVHVPANLAAATILLALAHRAGVSYDDLGLSAARLGAGARAGLAVAAPIVAGIGLAARGPLTASYFADPRVLRATPRRAAYETAIRIPIGTGLGEELLFRGALLGLLRRRHSTARAVAISSLVFGLWHVLPTLNSLAENAGEETGGGALRGLRVVAGNVAATTAAGVGFSVLRLRSRSVLAPVIVHAAINSSAFLATRRVPRS